MTSTTATLSYSATIARYFTLTSNLNLEGSASSSSSSPFELSSLGSYIGFGGTVRHTRCFTHVTHASLALRRPCTNKVFLPVGAFNASWSKVRISPPALRTRTRALSVNRRAQIVNLGTSSSLISSVTVPTTTQILSPSERFIRRAIRAKEIGGLLILLINNRFKMTLLNFASVRRARKRYNFTRMRR